MNRIIITSIVVLIVVVLLGVYVYNFKVGKNIVESRPVQRGAGHVMIYSDCYYKGIPRLIQSGYYKIASFGDMPPIMSIDVPKGMIFTMLLRDGRVININHDIPCMRFTRYQIVSIRVWS